MRGGAAIMKRILLIFLFLFMPLFASHSESLVIGSLESLTEKNLPLDVDLLYDAFYNNNRVDSQKCDLDASLLYNLFISGHMKIPFSAKELLKVCRKTVRPTLRENSDFMFMKCKEECSRYVLDYVKGVVEKSNVIPVHAKKR